MIISSMRRVSRGAVRAAALAVAVSLPAALSAQAFEGSITMRMTAGGSNGGVQDIEYLARAGNVRINLNTPGGALAILSLATEQKVFLMMDAQKSYSEISGADQNQLATATEATVTMQKTGRKETVAGYECEHVIVETPAVQGRAAQRTDVCMSKALGPFINPRNAMAGSRAPTWQRQLEAQGGSPLKVTGSDGTVMLEVTTVTKRRVSDAIFRIPDDFNKMTLPRRP